jgi:hypothetical protein
VREQKTMWMFILFLQWHFSGIASSEFMFLTLLDSNTHPAHSPS